MMASRKTGAGVSRPRQMSSKKGGMAQFAFIGVAVVVVVVVALLLFAGGGKKGAPTKAKKAVTGDVVAGKKAHKSPHVAVASSAKSGRDAERAKRREERLKHQQEPRGARTSRSSSGGYSQGGTSRGSSSRGGTSRSSSADPSELRAIVTDGAGSRFALVGEKQFKSGDDIEGHKILEVSPDGVKMEYRQSTYTVKVGQKVY